jgi:crotonobetainyl-CoA:carnitine CoA-transferase CaiB-like acyl-CoA transferase
VGGPLDGVTVVDLTTTFSGPYGTLHLAQMGADVIKVESPSGGDVTRSLVRGRHVGMSPLFLNLNHGKRSVSLDLKHKEGNAALRRVLTNADVFVHNMRKSAAARLGLTYSDLRAVNDSLVYGSISGFGEGGPYSDRPAYDDIIQAMSGIASLQRLEDGRPTYVRSVVADKVCGLSMANAVLAGLLARQQTGVGTAIEIPMYETMASFMLVEHMVGETYCPPVGAAVYSRSASVYRRPYRTADGYLSVLVYTDSQWRRFLNLAGRADLIEDERFATAEARTVSVDFIYAFVEEVMGSDTTEKWLDRLRDADIPAGPIQTIDELLTDDHLEAVALIAEVEHPTEGRIRVIRPAPVFGADPQPPPPKLAPRLGADTRAVLVAAGYTSRQVDGLIASKAAYEPERGEDTRSASPLRHPIGSAADQDAG